MLSLYQDDGPLARHAPTGHSPWPVVRPVVFLSLLWVRPAIIWPVVQADPRSCVFTSGRSGNALNTRRLPRSVNEAGSDPLSVRQRRAGRHAQCWAKSKFSIVSYEIDSISIKNRNRIQIRLIEQSLTIPQRYRQTTTCRRNTKLCVALRCKKRTSGQHYWLVKNGAGVLILSTDRV